MLPKVICPQCQTALALPEPIKSGRGVRCPKCQLKFIPPDESPVAAAPPSGSPVGIMVVVLLAVGLAVGGVVWNQLSNQKTAPVPSAQTKPPPPPEVPQVDTSSAPGQPAPKENISNSEPIKELEPEPKKPPSVKVPPPDDDLPEITAPQPKKAPPKTYAETKPPVVTTPPSTTPPAVETPAPTKPPPAVVFRHPKQEQINLAIDRGVEMIRRGGPLGVLADSNTGGGLVSNHPIGYAALRGLTLLECDVSAKDPMVQQIAQLIRNSPLPKSMFRTYDLATALLFLDRLGDPRDRDRIQRYALLLVAGQTPRGIWGYEGPDLSDVELRHLLTVLEATQPSPSAVADDPLSDLKKKPARSRPALPGRSSLSKSVQLVHIVNHHYSKGQGQPTGFYAPQGADFSNTQFALLALWRARHHGVPSDRCLERAAEMIRGAQKGDGGWAYKAELIGIDSSPAMTCVGLLGLAMGHAAAPAAKSDAQGKLPDDPAIARALARIGAHIDANEFSNNFYFLWSLERVGMLYKLKTIGGRDWYDLGVEMLLPAQQSNGSWTLGQNYVGGNAELSTSFALLFLKRSNLVQDLTERLPLLMTISDPAVRPNR